MGLFKNIKNSIPPDEISVSGGVENLMRDIADDNDCFENMVFEYGIKSFVKTLDKKIIKKKSPLAKTCKDMRKVLKVLEENVDAMADCCGEDDYFNFLPAKDAYEKAKSILVYLNEQEELMRHCNNHA